ncbi:MAG: inorganic diphosphatase, partial [Pseudomonadota bacterium]|nr:inorganic diphosphatase [Pseudomonadota bacterium]
GPLDICVISERPINHSEIILNARVLGGLPMMDHGEADDKIIAVLDNDLIWDGVQDISELPEVLVERLRHYFSTYKLIPGEESLVTIGETYGHEHAMEVIKAAMADYQEEFGG